MREKTLPGWFVAAFVGCLLLVSGLAHAQEQVAKERNATWVKPTPGTGENKVVVGPDNVGSQSVFLAGDFIEVGIHSAGSFGAADTPPQGFHPTDQHLGFVVDGDGWGTGASPVVGDFFVPGEPEEVWGLSWSIGDGVVQTFMNAGLLGRFDVPVDTGFPNDISVGDDRRSVWQGTASYGDYGEFDDEFAAQQLRVTQTVSFRRANKFFVINVVLTNIGTTDIPELKYLRSVEPDQEFSTQARALAVSSSTTENYIVAQPPRGELPEYPPGNVARALVIGRGISTGVPVGLGAIDRRARVSHGGFSVRDPTAVLTLGITDEGPLSDSGRENNPSEKDEAISLAFDLGTLAPGQSVSIDYAYILDATDLEVALGQLSQVTILQPTGTVSGGNALFQVAVDNPASETVQVDFYVAGQLIGRDAEGSRSGIYEFEFDTLTLNAGKPLVDGPVTIEAVALFADQSVSRKSATVSVDNAGPLIAFTDVTPPHGANVFGTGIPIQIEGRNSQDPLGLITIFREVGEVGNVSQPLIRLAEPPYSTTLDVSDLAEGTSVVIKAVASNLGNTAITTISRTFVVASSDETQTTVVAPLLPLSEGARTIYTAVSPSTPQGKTSLLSALAGNDPTLTRAFAWDSTIASYVELPSQPTGNIQVFTGIFIATRVPLSYNLSGSPSQNISFTVRREGWTFAGIPPLEVGEGSSETTFNWPFSLGSTPETGTDLQVIIPGNVAIQDAMGTPAGAPETSRPWFWNGSAYEQVNQLQVGRGYWFKNNLINDDITLTVATAQASLRSHGLTPINTRSSQPVIVRDQGSPPSPPSSASKSASSSSAGGCGSGSGLATFALLMFIATLRFVNARR